MLGSGNNGGQKPGRPGRRRNRFALSFDGSNDYVDTGQTNQAIFRSDFSVGVWVKPDDGRPAANDYIVGGIESGNTDGLIIYIATNGKLNVSFKSNSDPLTKRTDAAIFADGAISSWMHILVVVTDADPTTITIYTNGTEEASSVVSSQELSRTNHRLYECNDNIWIGAANANGSGSNFFSGDMDEYAVWSGAISAAQAAVVGAKVINLRQQKGNYGAGPVSKLNQWLRFEEGQGTRLRDRSGKGYHATVSGASFVKGTPAIR
jgi:hypothetical protein